MKILTENTNKKNFNHIESDAFHYDRIFIQKITYKNRNHLFVEVNQKELNENIFFPIKNLSKYESLFFPKRFAILGDYKTGKTELVKYIINKLNNHYENCISITINSQRLQYTNIDDINDWIYDQWFTALSQYDEIPEFTEIFYRILKSFKDTRGKEPEEYIDKVYLICRIYRAFLKKYPDSKFIIAFDQANLIEKEEDFQPFFQFWRNFQGYWEMDNYFSELPIFTFVIGHRNWINFVNLQKSVGRGVFDKWIEFDYWNNIDIEELFRKRLLYAIKPEYHKELLDYFLCKGIVEFFGKKLNISNTQNYLDEFFGNYLEEFMKNFHSNLNEYKDFLDFCRRTTTQKKKDDTYFYELERVFVGTPALDYMPVFQYLSSNQDSKWFNELFLLLQKLYDSQTIDFESKDFRKYKNLSYDFVYNKFTNSPFDDSAMPEYSPALLTNHGKILILNETFRGCLTAIQDLDQRGSIFMLKRFVKSKRIKRNFFDELKYGKEMLKMLKRIKNISSQTLELINRWVVQKRSGIVQENQEISENYLSRFYKIRENVLELNASYKGNSTNWAIFDQIGRDLSKLLADDTFPRESKIASFIDFEDLDHIKYNILSPSASNISLITLLNDAFGQLVKGIQEFNSQLGKKTSEIKETQIIQPNNVLLIIDGPNSQGQNYEDQIDIEKCVTYTKRLSRNADMYYFYQIDRLAKGDQFRYSRLGFSLQPHHKDIDHRIRDQIMKELKSANPPKTIVLCTKDGDFTDFIKNIRKNYNTTFKLLISSTKGLAASLKMIFNEEDLKIFPLPIKEKKKKKKIEQPITQPDDIASLQKSIISVCIENDVSSFEEIEIGTILKGRICGIKDFGAFIDIGIPQEGFLPKGKIANKYVDDVSDYLKLNEVRDFRIINIMPEKKQYTLSIIDV